MYVNVIGKIYSTEEDYKRYCKTNDDYHIVNHTQCFFFFLSLFSAHTECFRDLWSDVSLLSSTIFSSLKWKILF